MRMPPKQKGRRHSLDRTNIQKVMRNCIYSYLIYSDAGLKYHNGDVIDIEKRKAKLVEECDNNPVLGKVRTQLTDVSSYYLKPLLNMTCLLFDRDFWLLPECDRYDDNPYTKSGILGQPSATLEKLTVYGTIVWTAYGIGMILGEGNFTYGYNYTSGRTTYAPLHDVHAYWTQILGYETITADGGNGSLAGVGRLSTNPFTGEHSEWLSNLTPEDITEGLEKLEESACFSYFIKEDFEELFKGRQMTAELREVISAWVKKHAERLDTPAEDAVE